MLIINVDSRGIEKSLKELKSKVIKTRQNKKLFEQKEFVKKSVKRRKKTFENSSEKIKFNGNIFN